MKLKIPGLSGLGAAALVLAVGCQGSGAFAQLQEKLTKLEENQTQILDKLSALESKVGSGGGAPAKPDAQRPRPGRPDPSATYKVAVGDAQTKGPDDALVTIIEWSDFQ